MSSEITVEIKKEVEELVRELNYHSFRYHVLDSPVISDEEYDKKYRRLKKLEEEYGYLLPDSPTLRVGAPPLDRFEKVGHSEPMLSLDNAFSSDEVREFDERIRRLLKSGEMIQYTVEPKYDGLAIELTYRDGILFKASTRGDGYEGEDVTGNIKTIRSVPLKIDGENIPREIDIRGEVYMDIDDFENLNRERTMQGENVFANPRNAAAGSVRQLDSSITASRRLHLACYGIGAVKGKEFQSQWEFIQWLRESRFPTPVMIRRAEGIDEVLKIIQEIEENRGRFPFETDGAVIKVNDFALQRRLGSKTREPRWATAYKYPAHEGTTRVIKIEASVGRTGTITPVATLEPVRIGGVTVSRSTLHNWDELKRKDVRVGDWVIVERAGDVIPHVKGVIRDKRTAEAEEVSIPVECPACRSQTVREEGEVAVRCINLDCPAQVQERIGHFVGRGGLDIEGLGEKNVGLLYEQGLIRHFPDIFRLTKEHLLGLPRFAEKSARNLMRAIEKSKKTTLAKVLYALGIVHVGEYAAKILAQNFKGLDDLHDVSEERIMEIPQMGEKIARSLSGFFQNSENWETLRTLQSLGLRIENPDYRKREQGATPLQGLTFVITGTLPRQRKEVETMIEDLGGRIASSVSGNTDYLVAGSDPGSKLRKAANLAVKTISYDELLQLCSGSTEVRQDLLF